MRALVANAIGRGIAGVELADVDVPAVGDGEVLIDVAAVSASHLELSLLSGLIPGVGAPLTLGIDPAGTIVDVGSRVSSDRLGEVVVVKPNIFCGACSFCASGRESDCVSQEILGVHRDGGAADFVVVPSRSAFTVPAGLGVVGACAAVHTVPVALHMLRAVGDCVDGATVLVTGAAGAVGSAAVQIAKTLGAKHVIGAIRGVQREERVRKIGADHVVDLTGVGGIHAPDNPAPGGVDIVVETTGSGAVAEWSFGQLGWTGTMVTCAGRDNELSVRVGDLYRQRKSLVGVAASDAADVRESLHMVASGSVVPALHRVVDMGDYGSAYEALSDNRDRVGRVVLDVGVSDSGSPAESRTATPSES